MVVEALRFVRDAVQEVEVKFVQVSEVGLDLFLAQIRRRLG